MKKKQKAKPLGFLKTLIIKIQQRLFYDYLVVIFVGMLIGQFTDTSLHLHWAMQFITPLILSLFILISRTIREKLGRDLLPWTRFDNYGSDGSIMVFGFLLSVACNLAIFGFPTIN